MRFYSVKNVRATTEADRALIQAWIDKDPDHKGMSAGFFINPPDGHKCIEEPCDHCEQGTECMVWEDEQGPILYYRIARALRIDMQFDNEQRDRTTKALTQGFPWLAGQAKRAGMLQMIFSSVSKSLIAFTKKRLGFQESPNELICFVQGARVSRPTKALEKPAQTVRN